MLKVLVAVALLASSAAHAQWDEEGNAWAPPSTAEKVALGAVLTVATVDVLYSLDIKNHLGHELNPVLGEHPGDARLVATAAVSNLVFAALWYVAPWKRHLWRRGLPVGIVAFEIGNIGLMHNEGLRIKLRF